MIKAPAKIAAILMLLTCSVFLSSSAFAQGSIFGSVANSDATTPDSSNLSFFGFLDDTDEEIRIIWSVGAGYDNGNWYDDFQNYLTESAGNPYDYVFYNAANGEGYVLSGLIPNNSFQQENVQLAAVSWPDKPRGVIARILSAAEIEVSWISKTEISYHVYRRDGSSEGSFFRIDDPTGSLANPGVADRAFVDNTVDSGAVYDYLIIPENVSGHMGLPSDFATVAVIIESFLRGDPNADGDINIGDCIYLIYYIFRYGPEPSPLESGECNCDGMVDLGDIVYLINYIVRNGPPPQCY